MTIAQQLPTPATSADPSGFTTWLFRRCPPPSLLDCEIDQYLHPDPAQLQDVQDPIQWWLAQQKTYPTLSSLALFTLTSQRREMALNTLEVIYCMKN
ncbi:hypothetical protein RRF57_007785 [Xylaria bambusicola]|uniref:HAT C-terminal dimerisation domain-containing protein n=1 Tax=Xylaria bambusicola TaxID=326684 RepID=A0AAN7USL3_9PEZI